MLYRLAIIVGFSVITRRLRPLWTFALAGVVIVVFMALLHIAIDALGLYFELEAL